MHVAPIRVALVDDHLLLMEAVAEKINSHPQMQVVFKATNADDGLQGILQTQPDVVVMDVDIPGRGVFDVAAEVRLRLKQTKILFLTGFMSDVFIEHALKSKAAGYLVKGEPIEVLLESICRVAAGEKCFSKVIAGRMNFDPNRNRYTMRIDTQLAQLTGRQLELLRHLARGDSVKEVAKSMHLSQKSVDSHKYRIMHKLGIHDRVQLARYAIREGLMLP